MVFIVKDIAEQEKKLIDIDISTINYKKARRYFFLDYPIEVFGIIVCFWFFGILLLDGLDSNYSKLIVNLGYLLTATFCLIAIPTFFKVKFSYLNRILLSSIMVIFSFIYFSSVILLPPANQDEIGTYIGLPTPWNILVVLVTFIFFVLLFKRIILPLCSLEKTREEILSAKNIDYDRHLFFTDLDVRAGLFRQLKKGQQLGSIKWWELLIISIGSFFSPIITVFILHSNPNTSLSAIIMCLISLAISALFLYCGVLSYQIYKIIKEIDKKIGYSLIPVRATRPSFKRKF